MHNYKKFTDMNTPNIGLDIDGVIANFQLALHELYPEIPIPLDHKDPYTLLIAVLLSAQCTDVRVNQITPLLFAKADNPYDMIKISVEKLFSVISVSIVIFITSLSCFLHMNYTALENGRAACKGE